MHELQRRGTPETETAERILERADCLHGEEEVRFAIDQLALRVTAAVADEHPVLLCLMNGGLMFTGELAARLRFPLTMDYVHLTRYHTGITGGELTWFATPRTPLEDRVVILVDDVLDRGRTLAAAQRWAEDQHCRQILTAVLVDKLIDGDKPATAEFVGLETVDRYLFGHGMDWRGYWRNLPEIYALHPEDEAAELAGMAG